MAKRTGRGRPANGFRPSPVGPWQQVGEIGVDAGMVIVGDPSYLLFRQGGEVGLGDSFQEFTRSLGTDYPTLKQFRSRRVGSWGDTPTAVCTSTAYGDGVYKVYAQIDSITKRVLRIMVDFVEK